LETREEARPAGGPPAREPNEADAILADHTLDYLERVKRWAALPLHVIAPVPAPAEASASAKTAREAHLDSLYDRVVQEEGVVCVGVDGSVPSSPMRQATAAAVVVVGGRVVSEPRSACGRVSANEAELIAIRSGLSVATRRPEAMTIYVFSDSHSAIRKATNVFRHSSQGVSLDICRDLSRWFGGAVGRSLTFVHTPSKLRWKVQGDAHERAKGLSVPVGARVRTSVDAVRETADTSALAAWSELATQPGYIGRNFFQLERLDGKPLRPTTVKGGPWLASVGDDVALTARLTRCLTGHAPIGEYYSRFNIDESPRCDCGVPLQTRTHLICACPLHKRKPLPGRLHGLVGFLKANPSAFAFAPRA